MIKKIIRKILCSEPVNIAARWMIKTYEYRSRILVKTLKRYVQVSGKIVVKINELEIALWAAADDSLVSKLYYQNEWERDVTKWFSEFSKQYKNVIDAGANVGVFSLLAAKSNENSIVHAFEPNPNNYGRLQRNISLNFFENRINSHRVALGNDFNSIVFHLPDGDWISDVSSVYAAHTASFNDFKQKTINVPCTTLDRFCEEKKFSPRLIKIDVELYELQVLQGMKRILISDKPFIFCEIFNDAVKRKVNPVLDEQLPNGYTKKIEDILKVIGYHAYLFTPIGILHVDDLIYSPLSSMYLLLPTKLSETFYLTSEINKVISELSRD